MKPRIQGRSASGIARNASYQRMPYGSSASRSGSSPSRTLRPSRGRHSFICWSGRSSRRRGSASPVKPTLAVRGVIRSTPVTRT